MKRIIGDETAPDETPERVDRLTGITAARRLVQWVEEIRASRFEHSKKFLFALGQRLDQGPHLRQQGKFIGEEKCDAPVPFPYRLNASPGYLACRDEGVQAGRIVSRNACRENRSLKQRRGQRCPLQAFDGVKQRIEMSRRSATRR